MKFLFANILLFCLSNAAAQYSQEDWEDRDTWMNVSEIFDFAGIEKGNQVADIGCHEGYLSFHLSKRVGESGKVFAVDVEGYRLEKLKQYAKVRKVRNIEVILGDYDNPKLPKGSLDVVIVMDTYHEIDGYMEVLGHIKKALKPSGKVLILEKLKEQKRGKSREEQARGHTLSSKYVKEELKQAGFTVTKEVKDFGDWQENEEKQMWIVVAEQTPTG
ncbi:methyltransferase domain-containing protein [Maribacter algarum]|uniref:Methyltransferase domain-containing protein n=1 Tax=Maribacter algarum (ex Zhang et al. 2020) TaxID=2578118 RepID=A0A5S3QJ43_9FLAO|nr:methyltransferase domain-containing protein [Maribacter algarum]